MHGGGSRPIRGHVRMPLLRRRSNGFEASSHHCDHVAGVAGSEKFSPTLERHAGVLVLADFQHLACGQLNLGVINYVKEL